MSDDQTKLAADGLCTKVNKSIFEAASEPEVVATGETRSPVGVVDATRSDRVKTSLRKQLVFDQK
jgi:hypothetical protein